MKTLIEIYRDALQFYADQRNWTNAGDWPEGDQGCVVLSRDASRRDMDTPGWTEAEQALKGADKASD